MKFKLFGKTLVVLTLVAIFGLLGLWQLDAANDLQEAKNAAPDPIVYQLSDLASPATALDSRSVAKKVSLRGNYILTFRAPNQIDQQGLMSVDLQAVVQPRQFEDRVRNSPGVISRIDSSVIVALTDLDLYDGFLVATGEQVSEGVISRDRIDVAEVKSKATGYYWQHISYVIIWWLMAAIVIYLPFYRKRQERDTLSA